MVRRQPGKVKLSALLTQCPSLFDDKKVSVVDKGLTDIDVLPRHFHRVKVSVTLCTCSLLIICNVCSVLRNLLHHYKCTGGSSISHGMNDLTICSLHDVSFRTVLTDMPLMCMVFH